MFTEELIKSTLDKNINWFLNSGVMVPQDGTWGIAERIAVTENNTAIEKMYAQFPAWTEFDGYSIIEQRRADCNFEGALLFLLASETLDKPEYREIAENILDYLYFKSGLLNRFNEKHPLGTWNWSHIKWTPYIWFDDNAWNGIIQLIIARKYPELEKKYNMTHWSCKVAESLLEAFDRAFESPHPEVPNYWSDPDNIWMGNLKLPHWGALACMSFAMAYSETSEEKYIVAIKKYFEFVWEEREEFIVSEDAYVLIGASFISSVIDDPFYEKVSCYFADKIIGKMDPETGNIPAEHYEAPTGSHLADMIYTVNWALLGMQMHSDRNGNDIYKNAFEKLLELTVRIQDDTDAKQFYGCWRGMYDMEAKEWGGGDHYEGGAGSIYTGWTNAPISWVLAYSLMGTSLR